MDLAEINAQVKQAESAVQKASRDLERVKNLYADQVVTLEQVQNAETALDMATSNLNIARFNQQHATIYAPTDGRILKRFVEENEFVAPGTPIFRWGSAAGNWVVKVGVSDRDVARLHLGDPATVYFDAYPDQHFRAMVSQIAEAADPRSGTFEVELSLEPAEVKLVNGFIAKVDIQPANPQSYFVIPVESLIEGDAAQGFVFAVDENRQTVRKLPIRMAYLFERHLAVSTGLEGIGQVVTEGAPYLSDGSIVQVVN